MELAKISDISISNKRVFNDAQLEAHHALIPLKKIPVSATEAEKEIYNLIFDRFMIAFASPCIYNKKFRHSQLFFPKFFDVKFQ